MNANTDSGRVRGSVFLLLFFFCMASFLDERNALRWGYCLTLQKCNDFHFHAGAREWTEMLKGQKKKK